MTRTRTTIVVVAVAALIGVVAVASSSEGGYRLSAEFENAGRLVEGTEVRIAGREVGSVTGVGLTRDGLARIELQLGGDDVPVPRGTRAQIRAVGAATLTNNFVELLPGPDEERTLDSGAVLPVAGNRGIVDIDAVLSTFTPGARKDLQTLFARGGDVFAGSGAGWFNGMLEDLDPALRELRGAGEQLASDRAQVGRLVQRAATAASAIASRRDALTNAIEHTAKTMTALSGERAALGDAIRRAPALLDQGQETITATARTVRELRPTLRLVPAASRPLDRFLRSAQRSLPRALPVARRLETQLPRVRRTLVSAPALERPATRALRSLGDATRDARPILRGFRFYAPDFLVGILNGLLTIGSGNYNKYGHYVHVSFVQIPQDMVSGVFSGLLSDRPLIPDVLHMRRHLDAVCPGGGAPPAPDGSNPWRPDPELCDPADDMPAAVNQP